MYDEFPFTHVATRRRSSPAYHRCSCGESPESTKELLAHARSEHGTSVR